MLNFTELTAAIIRKRETGLLTLVPKNGAGHVKIFIAEGEIYHVSYGDLKNADCLAACEKLEFSDCFFGSGAKVSTNEKCPIATGVIIERLNKYMDKAGDGSEQNFRSLKDRLKTAMVRQVGPIGAIIFSNVVDEWKPSSPPTRQELAELVSMLEAKIMDEKGKKAFIQEAKAIIS